MTFTASPMVGDSTVQLEVTLRDGGRGRIRIPMMVSANEEMDAIERRVGRYANGWATLSDGNRVRVDEIRAMRPISTPAADETAA